MSKILAVARTEYRNAVQSKAFIVGVLLMPIIMGGAIFVQKYLEGRVDTEDRVCGVVDGTGELFELLSKRAEERNAEQIFETVDGVKGRQTSPRFILERYEPDGETRPDVALSERVRNGELFGFLIIDPSVLSPPEASTPPGSAASAPGASPSPLAYHTATPTYRDLSRWLRGILNDEILKRRFVAADVDQKLVQRLSQRVSMRTLGLVSVDESGNVTEAKEENRIRTFGIPLGAMMLLFMLVMMSAPALLNQVLEEKMQRIAEVLVSAVTPFQLMMGKLIGTVFVSMTLAVLYLGAVIYTTHHFGVADSVPTTMYAWFVLFQIMALFMYGSIFSSFGAACSEMRDAQSLMTPAMLLIMIPFFCWVVILENPNSTFATLISLFPPATPMLMMLRIAVPPGPPLWEVLAGIVLCGLFTVACVAAGGKIFRIGILAQGQAPSLGRLAQWVISK